MAAMFSAGAMDGIGSIYAIWGICRFRRHYVGGVSCAHVENKPAEPESDDSGM
jgi:hypothetical protein